MGKDGKVSLHTRSEVLEISVLGGSADDGSKRRSFNEHAINK